MRRFSILTSIAALTAAVAGGAIAPAMAAQPGVINGTPNPPFAGAAVYYQTSSSACTGALLLPNLIVTAGHCVIKTDASPYAAAEYELWAPGVNTDAQPASNIKVTQVVYNPAYVNREGQEGIDVAYLVLDGALGTPVITRVANQSEVVALAARDAVLSMAGYGTTVPRSDPNAVVSPVPIGMSAAIDSDYAGGDKYLTVGTNGVTGTCTGDSGSSWVVQQGAEVLLVGVTSSGDNPPCEPVQDSGTHDYLAVVAGQGSLLAQAQQAAGSQPAPVRTTCIKVPGAKQKCLEGSTWTYDYCWDASRYRLEKLVGSTWQQVRSAKAPKYSSCAKKTPYRVLATGTADPGTTKLRIVIPKQPGITRVTYDPFTVTSS